MKAILERDDLEDPFAVDNVLSSLSTAKYATRTLREIIHSGERILY